MIAPALGGGEGEVGVGVEGLAVEFASGGVFADAAPLFEEEGDVGVFALLLDAADPVGVHGAGFGAGFSADDYPVDSRWGF